MGARSSKTRPTTSQRRRGTFETLVVAVNPREDYKDEALERQDARTVKSEASAPSSPVRVGKVQEILESRSDAKAKTAAPATNAKTTTPKNRANLELEFSSSEDSDDVASSNTNASRKGKKKRRKKKKKKTTQTTKQEAQQQKIKLNEVRNPRKTIQARPLEPKEHFEQIKDAYALAEYMSKEAADDEHPAKVPQPPSKDSTSPISKLFGGTFDMWKKPAAQLSRLSSRSLIAESRDVSRHSRSGKSMSSRSGRFKDSNRSVSSNRWQTSLTERQETAVEALEQEIHYALQVTNKSSSAPLPRQNQSAENPRSDPRRGFIDDSRIVSRVSRRQLRIDDTDESIMDTILAETNV
ncbi:hypothetical protein Poli38472_005069 [Pythium oligandrum]|uniref:Uncharacterized protein n=1 Tax=Pythium oligandrum TaxID=41045 RepID=A0A8K1CFE5_PYTOL|nr:hypothetical protein Poli38472_005069 [Pythium oligandrum]|eukprot:TMW62451.1 hypothetical protein Poli38472_005069 [Pythium oligandrum]